MFKQQEKNGGVLQFALEIVEFCAKISGFLLSGKGRNRGLTRTIAPDQHE
jgi:hypothetical protein